MAGVVASLRQSHAILHNLNNAKPHNIEGCRYANDSVAALAEAVVAEETGYVWNAYFENFNKILKVLRPADAGHVEVKCPTEMWHNLIVRYDDDITSPYVLVMPDMTIAGWSPGWECEWDESLPTPGWRRKREALYPFETLRDYCLFNGFGEWQPGRLSAAIGHLLPSGEIAEDWMIQRLK